MAQPDVDRRALHSVLKEFGLDRFHIEYNVYFSNHLLHAVVALDQLGASEARLTDYAQRLSEELDAAHAAGDDMSREDWRTVLGRRERFPDLCRFFRGEVARRGRRGAVSHYLPQLMDGAIACSAFHPIIHLGYGLLAESERDIGDGLAYVVFEHRAPADRAADASIQQRMNGADSPVPAWASSLQEPVAKGLLSHPVCSLVLRARQDVRLQRLLPLLRDLVDVHGLEKLAAETGFGLFSNRLFLIQDNAIALINDLLDASGLFASVTGDAQLTELYQAVQQGALLVYASTAEADDFFLLHGVTASLALAQVLPLLPGFDERLGAVRTFCRDLLTAYVLRDMPALVQWTPAESDLPSWQDIRERTVADRDEHLIKLVFSCQRMEQEFGERLFGHEVYRAVAAYKSGLRPWPRMDQ